MLSSTNAETHGMVVSPALVQQILLLLNQSDRKTGTAPILTIPAGPMDYKPTSGSNTRLSSSPNPNQALLDEESQSDYLALALQNAPAPPQTKNHYAEINKYNINQGSDPNTSSKEIISSAPIGNKKKNQDGKNNQVDEVPLITHIDGFDCTTGSKS
jgi:hypothetical protein